MTNAVHAAAALLPDGWSDNVRIMLDNGLIRSVEVGMDPAPDDERHSVLVPAMPNLHSHAFQRAMAGLAEIRGSGSDNFWSWRELMYRFALSMTPDQMEAIAAQLYVEMLEAGFGRVGEFHYLHHDGDGRPYANIAEMAERIAAAAGQTGIRLTLLLVFYARSGFGGAAPTDGQRRFINSLEGFARLLEGSRAAVADLPDAVVGVAPHSLRAVSPEELSSVVPMAGAAPVHIHVAEQTREVEDCIAWSGMRPVEWLLENVDIDRRWCLIHATHMTSEETLRMAKSGAVAGLCPITEANLGDGIFPGAEFVAAAGAFGVGSDSNVLIGVGEELRQFEYSQRLGLRIRNVMTRPGGSNGCALFEGALTGGSRALGAESALEEGSAADFVALDISSAPYLKRDQVLDGWIFAGSVRPDCVWVNGTKLVERGRHRHRDRIAARFHAAMKSLVEA